MNDKFTDYYKLLGITPRASFESIRKAAEHELSQNWNNAIGRLEIQEAYEVLSDPKKRKEYDEEFNKRLSERELAIRNARTFEEYIAATSLHSELANVEVAPEVEVPQEEQEELENSNINAEDVSKNNESIEEKIQEESTINSYDDSVSSEPSSEDTETSQDSEEEVEEIEQDQEHQQEELEEELKEQEEKPLEEEPLDAENKVLEQEENQIEGQEKAFINIPVQRLEKEQKNETIKENKEEVKDEPIISRAALKEIIRAAIIAGGIGLGCLTIGPSVIGVTIGLMAGVATGDFFKKHAKLERKESKPKVIKEINTQETKFLNDYAETLENQIYNLLDKPNKNYELEIAIRKYENLKELVNNRINFKSKEVQKNCTIFKRLELVALEKKLESLNKTLTQLTEKRNVYESKSVSRLSQLNQKISDKSHKISELESVDSKKEVDKKKVERAALLKKRDAKANRMYVNKDLISFGQVTLVKLNSAVNIVKSVVDKFSNLNTEKQLEESSTKSL